MNLTNKIYYYNSFRTTIYGSVFLLVGLLYSYLQISLYASTNITGFSFLISFLALLLIGILLIYFGVKILINRNSYIELELQNHQIKYLLVGTARFSGLSYFINQKYDTIKYSSIENIEGVSDFGDLKISIKLKNGREILIPTIFRNRKEKEGIIHELKKYVNVYIQNSQLTEN